MIVVHHLEFSRSTRILWLLEELNLEYTLKTYQRHPKTIRAPKDIRTIHPLGRAPLVEADGYILAESGAIIEYFADRENALRPTDKENLLHYRYWLHYAEGSAMPPMLLRLVLDKLRDAPLPFFLKPLPRMIANRIDNEFVNGEIEAHFGWIESRLGAHPFFAGDAFSAADIQMSFPIQASFTRGRLDDRPHSRAWLQKVTQRPAYQKAIKQGGEPVPAAP